MWNVIVGFICMGLVELWGTQSKRKLQNEKILPTMGFEPPISSLWVTRSTSYTKELIYL